MKPRLHIGGQAVIEGVMMRGPRELAVAVRQPDGGIAMHKQPIHSVTERYPFLKLPLLRGVVALIEALVYGLQALSFSARIVGEGDEQLTGRDIAVTMIVAFGIAIVLFIIIPTGAAKLIKASLTDPLALNVIEGLIRIAIFLLYIAAISRIPDIQRVFQYHGAEHKVIHAWEAGEPLAVGYIQKHSTLHPRCGTNFLLTVMIVSIVLFAFLGWPSLFWRIVSRIVLLPVVAGIAYEVIKFAGTSDSKLMKTLIAPGLWLQKLTTREPDNAQIEVAVRALEAVLPDDVVVIRPIT